MNIYHERFNIKRDHIETRKEKSVSEEFIPQTHSFLRHGCSHNETGVATSYVSWYFRCLRTRQRSSYVDTVGYEHPGRRPGQSRTWQEGKVPNFWVTFHDILSEMEAREHSQTTHGLSDPSYFRVDSVRDKTKALTKDSVWCCRSSGTVTICRHRHGLQARSRSAGTVTVCCVWCENRPMFISVSEFTKLQINRTSVPKRPVNILKLTNLMVLDLLKQALVTKMYPQDVLEAIYTLDGKEKKWRSSSANCTATKNWVKL